MITRGEIRDAKTIMASQFTDRTNFPTQSGPSSKLLSQ